MKDRLMQFWSDYRSDALWSLGVALIAFTAFGLGRATAPIPKKVPLTVEPLPTATQVSDSTKGDSPSPQDTSTPEATAKTFVASKSGTKYYFPTCSGVKRIKEENKIWFSTEQEAKDAGYEPAVNCPGL